MSLYRQTFSNQHAVLPVIHVVDEEQAGRNAKVAIDAGADGVFLISHGDVGPRALLSIAAWVAIDGARWVGVNCLGQYPFDVFTRLPPAVKAVWSDDAMPAGFPPGRAKAAGAGKGLYFGGVAFKYQPTPVNSAQAAVWSMPYVDVVTTSGDATGVPPTFEKIQAMRNAMHAADKLAGRAERFPLAIASGITPENVSDYLPYADAFLVATGISSSFTELDAGKTRVLVQVVRAWDA